MKRIVAKFGGSSLADGAGFLQVARLLGSDPARRIAVVSAPGKRREGDEKVTDLLLSGQFRRAYTRFDRIASELGLPPPDKPDPRRMAGREFAASRGEEMCARLLAALMGWRFLDAAQVIRFDEAGRLREEETRARLRAALSDADGVVLPGFYGARPDGRIGLFPRGGSDITGALAAEAVNARVYENWTDVCGVRRADPRVLPDAPRIERMSYGELRALAEAGAQVIHESALEPIRRARVPMHIRCTFAPEGGGTWVSEQSAREEPGIVALAGRGNRTLLHLPPGAPTPACEMLCRAGDGLDCLVCGPVEGAQGGWARLTLVGRFSPAALEAVFHALARAEVFPRLIELDAAHAALRLALPEDRLEAAVRALGRADPI